jgi:hypothetical protein
MRRIGEVDHHLRAGHGLLEALAGDGVDAAVGRGGDDLVAALAQNGDTLRADQAGAADDEDLHGYPPLSKPRAQRLAQFARRRQGRMAPSANPKASAPLPTRDLDLGTGPQVATR